MYASTIKRELTVNILIQLFKWDTNHGPSNARLHRPKVGKKTGAWSSRINDKSQWIQVDLRGIFKVTKIATQGRQDWAQWVTQYKVSYSTYGVHFNFQKKVVTCKTPLCLCSLGRSIELF